MTKLEEFFNLINYNYISDIILLGYVYHSENNYLTFSSLESLYIEINNKYINFSIFLNRYDGKIKINIKNFISFDELTEIEEDSKHCTTSLTNMLYSTLYEKNYLKYFKCLYSSEEELKKGIFLCIELGFENPKTILLDSVRMNGLQIDIGGTIISWRKSIKGSEENFPCKEFTWENKNFN